MDSASCPTCGSHTLVTVVSKDEGKAELRSYCPDCQRRAAEGARAEIGPFEAVVARILMYGGLVLALLTASADYLSISGRTGFGWRQMTGTELGFLATVLGLATRRALVVVVGLLLLVLSLGADLFHFGHRPGFGWRSQLGFALATAMFAGGLAWHRTLARRPAPPESH